MKNNPTSNYAMYDADREAKRKAQPSLPSVTASAQPENVRDYEQDARNYHNRGYYPHEVANDSLFWEAVRIESDKRTA